MGKDINTLNQVTSIMRSIYHNGTPFIDAVSEDAEGNIDRERKEVIFQDLVTDKDLARFIPEAVTSVLLEEIEPAAVIVDNLFTFSRITSSGSLLISDTGPLTAGPIGANGEYPDQGFGLTTTGHRLSLTTQKYGLALSLQEEVLRNNNLSILSLWMRKAANALIRNREAMALHALLTEGIVMFDNANPTGNGMWDVRNLSGRDISGAQNGTFSLNDLMELYAYTQMEGFTMDTVLMNPLAWMTFMTDPEMKEIVLSNNAVVSFRPPLGNRSQHWNVLESNGLGLNWTGGTGNSTLDPTLAKLGLDPYQRTPSVMGATFNIPPRYFPTPLKIVITPYVPLTQVGSGSNAKYMTDIIFAQAGEAGLFVRKEDPMTDKFTDSWKETVKIKMREEIGIGILNQGKAVRIAKNVVIDRNYVFQNTNSVTLSPLDRVGATLNTTTGIFG
jgi:hypothetical protein